MHYRPLGRTGLEASVIALGTMTFGREADADTSAQLYAAAREAGVNVIDTADNYAGGESERLVGKLIGPERDAVILATKAGTPYPGAHNPRGANARGASARHLRWGVEQSLTRLRTDRIDLYYVHYFDPFTDLDHTLRALDDLVSAGKIIYPCFSNFAAWQVAKALGRCELRGWAKPAALQPMYSLLKRQAEVEILPMCQSEGLGVFVYSPLAAGILSGKYSAKFTSAEAARLNVDPKYQGRYPDEKLYALGQLFAERANDVGLHPVTLANAWCLHHPALTGVLVGARNLEQLLPALAAGDVTLSDEQWQACAELVPVPPLATDREEERSRGPSVR